MFIAAPLLHKGLKNLEILYASILPIVINGLYCKFKTVPLMLGFCITGHNCAINLQHDA